MESRRATEVLSPESLIPGAVDHDLVPLLLGPTLGSLAMTAPKPPRIRWKSHTLPERNTEYLFFACLTPFRRGASAFLTRLSKICPRPEFSSALMYWTQG